jgi:hypothetical protein
MGAGPPAYQVTKAALNALTRTLAGELRGSRILVNAVCPDWVATDMGGAGAPRSVREEAAGIVWAATLPDNGPTGGFFRDANRYPGNTHGSTQLLFGSRIVGHPETDDKINGREKRRPSRNALQGKRGDKRSAARPAPTCFVKKLARTASPGTRPTWPSPQIVEWDRVP